ncbi:MAG: septum formation initiator family protein [Clostridia bacterium]|nr:septum formation initiator family protein [Clostridia bacterium]
MNQPDTDKPIAESPQKKRSFKEFLSEQPFLKKLIVIACIACVAIGFGIAVSTLSDMFDTINANNEIYEAKLEENESLLRREQMLESMVEYSKSHEYMLQLARERFGYVLPDDIIFQFDISGDNNTNG